MNENNDRNAELADLMYIAREGLTEDYGSLLENLIEHLIEEGLGRDQITLFLDILLYVEQLPN